MARLVGARNGDTPNKVELSDGKTGNLSCAGDILLTGLFGDLRGSTKCPVCGRTVEVEVRDKRLVGLYPSSAVLHYVRVALPNPSSFGIECETTYLFDRDECLNHWLRSHPLLGGKVVAPQGFMDEAASVKGIKSG